jgi:hypothetical protein
MDDEHLIGFWHLDQVRPMKVDCPQYVTSDEPDLFMFADNSIWAIGYAVRLATADDAATAVFLIDGDKPFELAKTFEEFLRRYSVGDQSVLFGPYDAAESWHEEEQRIQRILAAIGDVHVAADEAFRRWYRHLASRLLLPCDVTGIEDFQWEEFFVVGPGNRAEYRSLRQNQPSYRDVFELMSITLDSQSEWCMVPDELKAHVRRKTDGKRFVLGLSELKATNKDSQNYQMLHDYSVWLVNYR